jgi:hypothetical protein
VGLQVPRAPFAAIQYPPILSDPAVINECMIAGGISVVKNG